MNQLPYELAKQLKDAGFPQRGDGIIHIEKGQEVYDYGAGANPRYSARNTEIPFYNPTLSELIEACGEGFFAISHWYDGWQSEGGPIIQTKGNDIDKGDKYTAQIQVKFCSSPEEAVAKLWMILNK